MGVCERCDSKGVRGARTRKVNKRLGISEIRFRLFDGEMEECGMERLRRQGGDSFLLRDELKKQA